MRQPGFIGELDTRLVDEFDNLHRLLAPFGFYSAILGREVTAPADFLTDFASVPRIVGAYLLYGGKGKRAAVIHDLLYHTREVDRKTADAVFHEALAASGYSGLTAGPMWAAVRVGGWVGWSKPNVPQSARVEDVMAGGA